MNRHVGRDRDRLTADSNRLTVLARSARERRRRDLEAFLAVPWYLFTYLNLTHVLFCEIYWWMLVVMSL